MDSLIFELQIVFYFQLFLSANVRHTPLTTGKTISCSYPGQPWQLLACVHREEASVHRLGSYALRRG